MTTSQPNVLRSALKRVLQPHFFHVAQAGQDLWVFGEVFNEKRGGDFLDLGAHDGILFSNSYLLEKKYGWTGICVEANSASFAKLKKNRRAICVHTCLDSTPGFVNFAERDVMGGIVSGDTDNTDAAAAAAVVRVETRTLESVLVENHAPTEIDYLSIDVEGAEQRVLGNFDFKKYRFKCITIERPSDLLRQVFQENGYLLIKEIPGLDCFYLHESMAEEYVNNLYAFYWKKRLLLS
jgi:FkbM family methyltransferase